MKLVIQRVKSAQVSVENKVIGKIDSGLFILVGIKDGDSEENVKYLADKVKKLRILADAEGKMNLSIQDTNQSIFAVSQFTLYADTDKGNRPSFIKAAAPDHAKGLYDYFVELLRNDIHVETGKFGAYMDIDANLDGPVTIILES